MKKAAFTAITSAAFIVLPAVAMSNDRTAVMATDSSTGSMTLGDVVTYMKSFDVTLINMSSEATDLAATCLVARTADGERFGLDTVDEALTNGNLGAGESVTGAAIFGSDTDRVLEVTSVHLSSDC